MAYEFKRLSDVEKLTETPEGASALAEVDGAIKRIPVANGGSGGNAKPEDLMFDLSIDLSSSGTVELMDSAQLQKMYDANMSWHIVEISDPSGVRNVHHHVIPCVKDTMAIFNNATVYAEARTSTHSLPKFTLWLDMEEYNKGNIVVKQASIKYDSSHTVARVYASII